MRLSKSYWNVLLATAAVILMAGLAGAIFDSDDPIYPDSPQYNGSGGWVDGSGEDFSTGVWFGCSDSDNDFYIGCDSDHPDSVKLSNNQGKVDQRKRDNNGYAYLDVYEMGGIVEDTEFGLDCERVQLKGKSNDNNDRMDVQCMLKGCQIPEGLTVGQLQSAETCIDDAQDLDNIGRRVTNLRLNNNNELGGKITSKGVRD